MNSKRGNKHQGVPYFDDNYSGRQCTIIALVALSFLSLKLASQWTSSDIDSVLTEGHVRYIEHIISMGIEPRNLQHNEVPNIIRNFLSSGTDVSLAMDANYYGVVGGDGDRGAGAYDFESSLVMAFSSSPFVIATFSDYTVALYYCETLDTYYLFDSHSCGPFGERGDPFGTAILLEFCDLQMLQQYIINTYSSSFYEFSAVIFRHVPRRGSPSVHHQAVFPNLFTAVPIEDLSAEKSSHKINFTTVAYTKQRNANINITERKSLEAECGPVQDKLASRANNLFSKNEKKGVKARKRRRTTVSLSNIDHDHTYHEVNELFAVNIDDSDRPVSMHVIMPGEPLKDLTEVLLPNFFQEPLASNASMCTSNCNKNNVLSIERSNLYVKEINMKPEYACKVCKRILFHNQIYRSPCSYEGHGIEKKDILCQWCMKTLKKGDMCFLDFQQNNLNAGEIPSELKALSVIEKRCISLINTFFTLIVLPAYPVGQLGMKGLVIHLPMFVDDLVVKLPIFSNESMIACMYPSSVSKVPSFVDCNKVLKALEWLKLNNPLYHNITVNMSPKDEIQSQNLQNCVFEEIGTVPVDYCMPNLAIDEVIKSKKFVLPVASGRNGSLVNLTKLAHGEEKAFPTLFPFGKAGFNAKRPKKLTLLKYYKSRLYNVDERWRFDIPYLLTSVNSYEKDALFQLVSIFLKVRKPGVSTNMLQARNITCRNESSNADIMKNSYMFMKSLRGTAAYWKDVLFNLLAMVKNLGSPTLFMTLSANDYHWPELADMLGVSVKELPKAVKRNPLMTALHFERRWRALFKHVINGPSKPLGVVKDYFARVEFQSRGSPHLHIFFWIENAPTLQASNSEEIVDYIDSVISTCTPNEKQQDLHYLVSKLQIHSHRRTCRRGNK